MSNFISLGDAVDMTTLFRADRETILATAFQNQNILPKCETFERSAFDDVLAQSGCEGIRIYYGMNSSNQVHAVIVGVNSNDEDIIFPPKPGLPDPPASLVIENGKRCPNDCPASSVLNT